MQKINKIIIISLVLLTPVVVVFFLNLFGENKFELPVYFEEGIPVSECSSNNELHRVDLEIIDKNDITLPALFHFSSGEKFAPDLEKVFSKYHEMGMYNIIMSNDEINNNVISLDSAAYYRTMNCEMILGENQWITEAIPYKFVLIDKERRIRGYFNVLELEEIERLDIELDILLNY
ncbi:MAG: hypothetical protein ABFS32_04865 [Bacteroidota bacterium]